MNAKRASSSRLYNVLRLPFTAATWRLVGYHLAALPVGVLCVPLALVGGPAGRVQRALARRLLRVPAGEPGRSNPLRGLAHALVSAPLNLLAALVTSYGWLVVLMNVAYPLRPGMGTDADLSGAWGGPTLAGAWALHAAAGVLLLLLLPWLSKGLAVLQGGLAVRMLGSRSNQAYQP